MTEETVFKMEKHMDNDSIADQLHKIANKMSNREKISLRSGDQSVELETDRDAVFEIEVEREQDEESLELEIEWKTDSSQIEID